MADQQKKLKSQSENAVQLAIKNKQLIDANTALNAKVKVLDKVEAKMQGDKNMELHTQITEQKHQLKEQKQSIWKETCTIDVLHEQQ